MNQTELARMALARLLEVQRVKALALEGYELTGTRADKVRRSEIAEYVAGRLDRENSPRFRTLIRQAMELLRLRVVRLGAVYCYRGIKRRP